MEEDRYETIHITLKSRSDGKAWFDVLFDYITENCEGTDSDEDDCTCGMESMGGSGGTLEQCYAYETTVGGGLQPIDLAEAIINLLVVDDFELDTDTLKAVQWARKEIESEEYWNNRGWETEEDDEEEFELGEEFEPYFSNEELPEGILEILKGENDAG